MQATLKEVGEILWALSFSSLFHFQCIVVPRFAFRHHVPQNLKTGPRFERAAFLSELFLCHFSLLPVFLEVFPLSCFPSSFPLSTMLFVTFSGPRTFYFLFQLWVLKMSTCEVFNQICDLSFNSYSMPGSHWGLQPITWTGNLQQSPSLQATKMFRCEVFLYGKKLFELPVEEWHILLKNVSDWKQLGKGYN